MREVANEERGLFLITAGIEKPEMMEVLASSKDERNTWMQLIQDAMQSMWVLCLLIPACLIEIIPRYLSFKLFNALCHHGNSFDISNS